MDVHNLVLLYTARIESAGLNYMVTGSIAGVIYGEPRLTHDVDLVLELTSDAESEAFARVFPDDAFYCAPVEVINVERRRPARGHFNVIHHESGFKADIYPMGHDPLHRWGMEHRRPMDLPEGTLWVAPPEYVIIRKLEYFREGGSQKHLDDIAAMLVVSAETIDLARVQEEGERRGLSDAWEHTRKLAAGRR